MSPSPNTRNVLRFVQVALGAAIIYFAGRALLLQWGDVREAAAGLTPSWPLLLLASLIVLGAYAVQIFTWRALLAGWGTRLTFRTATHIWLIATLGRYVPGKVWQMGTMAMMAQRRGASPVGAIASALIATVIATVAGFGVAAVTGAQVLDFGVWTLLLIGMIALGMLALPLVLPYMLVVARRVTGREIPEVRLESRMVWLAFGAGVAFWLMLGLAFHVFAIGLLNGVGADGRALPGDSLVYISTFTASYLIGFLTLIAPGGVVVREAVLAAALDRAGFDAASAILLVVVSRIWLTVLEVAPAAIILGWQGASRLVRPAAPSPPVL